uniref:Secreted protein n=1 Tax=Parascaris univalens TaxID=6257 RepID=A0A915A382_PARUN
YHFICVVWSVLLPCSRGLVYPSTSGCSLASFDIEQRKLYSFRSWRLTVFTINNVLCSRQLQDKLFYSSPINAAFFEPLH